MKLIRRIFNPVIALVAIQLVWVVVVVLWVTWFVGRHRQLKELATRYSPELLARTEGWSPLVQGLLLLAAILAGVYTLFIFWRRQSRLYQEQREFITQVTHELKSPLASIQLHLETIQLRRPSAERLDSFVDTMLDDTHRLHSQIDNLLLAARIEQRRRPADRRVIDLSAFVQKYLDENRDRLPPGTRLELELEPDLKASVEPDELGTVLRNLLENAVLYSPGVPELELRLSRKGRWAIIALKDHGRGIAAEELRKIFRRFYRVELPGERIRGTGLGLSITKATVEAHGGLITIHDNPAGGALFRVVFPSAKQDS